MTLSHLLTPPHTSHLPTPSGAFSHLLKPSYIFSQWTTVLDVIGLALEHLAIKCVRFDGSTEVAERQTLVDDFNSDDSISAFLLTTRAGGLGINLTSADTVIIFDSDFNPAADKQAMDRCHRMGQTRPVRVIKLASTATVDERIVQIAAIKAKQQDTLLSGDEPAAGDEMGGATKGGAALMGSILRESLFGSAGASGAADADDA